MTNSTSIKGYKRVECGDKLYIYVKPDATDVEREALVTKAKAKAERKAARAAKADAVKWTEGANPTPVTTETTGVNTGT